MRTDENLSRSFRGSKQWRVDAFTGESKPELDRRVQEGGFEQDGQFLTHSHSGYERNHLFLSHQGKSFADVSTVSGVDTDKDSRGFAILDFDRDGLQDIALVNANAPLLNLFHNQIGQWQAPNGMIAIRFVGGNSAAKPSRELSARDAFGARVQVRLSDRVLVREHQCGEGFAVQNSATMIVGIGEHAAVDQVHVRWPSGATTTIEDVQEGTLLTVHEQPVDPTRAYVAEPYRTGIQIGTPDLQMASRPVINIRGAGGTTTPKLRIYTTVATWCAACVQQYPQLQMLNEVYGDDLQFYGMPVDPEDTAQKLAAYEDQHKPPYQMLTDPTSADRKAVQTLLEAILGDPPLPSTLATDGEGRVLRAWAGVPTRSQVQQLLNQ